MFSPQKIRDKEFLFKQVMNELYVSLSCTQVEYYSVLKEQETLPFTAT
jgi:hypothetical protein